MLEITEEMIMHNRPFGGVAFLWRQSIAKFVTVIGEDDNHRCIAIKLSLNSFDLLIFCVYLPCYASIDDHEVEILHVLAFMESIIAQLSDQRDLRVLICDDCNFDYNKLLQSPRLSVFRRFLLDSDICQCDGSDTTDINNMTNTFYFNTSSSSFIDHVFCSQSIKSDIVKVSVIDSGDNTSDHLLLT